MPTFCRAGVNLFASLFGGYRTHGSEKLPDQKGNVVFSLYLIVYADNGLSGTLHDKYYISWQKIFVTRSATFPQSLFLNTRH